MRSDLKLILEQMKDPDNEAPILLENDRGEIARFTQMALIPITTPSEEFENEMVDHYFALLQPVDENGEEVGEQLIFDFAQDEQGEINLSLVDNPYIIRNVITLYRQRGKVAEEEEGVSLNECDSIFGGTITDESEAGETSRSRAEAEEEAAQLEQELAEFIAPKKKKEKKSFFSKLFGKK